MADRRPLPQLLTRTTCPHCWHKFEPHEVLWISAHPSLRGDPRLGPDVSRRFLPARFTARGAARDELGAECNQLACPNCHLTFPRLCLELKPWFVSIFGAPSCGKSYYLPAMTWRLRRQLADLFRVSFSDMDAQFNQILIDYEQRLFHNPHPTELTSLGELIEKTQEHGDLYSSVLFDTQAVQVPRPFLFTIRPQEENPLWDQGVQASRILCLYDNAGESFLAGRDSPLRPVTRHLAESSLFLFLFDPTQNQPFRQRLGKAGVQVNPDPRAALGMSRQDLILTEAANRVRRFAGLPDSARHDKPLVVIVTKQDVWGKLIPGLEGGESPIGSGPDGRAALNMDRLEELSWAIRELLQGLTPEVVAAAESFAESVLYVGVSSLGTAPYWNPVMNQWMVRPKDLRPTGVELPLIYGLHKRIKGLIPSGRRSARSV